MQDCISRGRHSKPPVVRGALNNKTKLTEEDVEYIMKSSESNIVLAKMFGVTPQAIRWRRKQRG